jgi:hypothetical protein
MIRRYEPTPLATPVDGSRLNWRPAAGAGLIAGGILLLVPRGSPWSAFTFFEPVIMGRNIARIASVPLPVTWLLHLAISVLYGFIVSAAVVRLTKWRAILIGGFMGLVLYLLNFGIVSVFFPALVGAESLVAFTHIVFGLLAAGAYRGLLPRRVLA